MALEMNPVTYLAVKTIIDEMTDQEVLAQRLALLLDVDPTTRYGYEKMKPLLLEKNHARMHAVTAEAFLALSGERLPV